MVDTRRSGVWGSLGPMRIGVLPLLVGVVYAPLFYLIVEVIGTGTAVFELAQRDGFIGGLLFASIFAYAPFFAIFLLGLFFVVSDTAPIDRAKCVIWGGLIGVMAPMTAFATVFDLAEDAQAAVALVFAPIWAVLPGVVGMFVGWVVWRVRAAIRRMRTSDAMRVFYDE